MGSEKVSPQKRKGPRKKRPNSYKAKQTSKKTVTKDEEGHYIIAKGSIQQEEITFVNKYVPNIRAPNA